MNVEAGGCQSDSPATSIPDLVLFTAGFPFDGYESVLADELEVTAARFRRVYIIPSRTGSKCRSLPSNAVIVDLDWVRGWSRQAKLQALASHEALVVLAATLRHISNWQGYASNWRSYLDILATGILRARRLQEWIGEASATDAVFYDFWFENSTLALALLRRSGAIRTAVSRAHGFDIYDERWDGGFVPFREFKASHLDAVFVISEEGAMYLRRKLGRLRWRATRSTSKIRLARLGVRSVESFPRGRADPPLVVSCSSMAPHKQVHLIPAVLCACDRPLRWVHFGDGSERPQVEAAAALLPPEVDWDLRGAIENAEVQRYYRTEPISAFLSVSATEGIPVSMMEVQRFGVPIVALAVGGVPELVTPDVGSALSPDATIPDIAGALDRALAPSSFDRARIRASFSERFDALANYGAFAEDLLSTWRASVGAT